MTPGPVAVNTATFVGYRTVGVLGSIAATLGVVLPFLLNNPVYRHFSASFCRSPRGRTDFYGIRPAVVALIGYAIYNLGRKILTNSFAYAVALGVFLVQLLFKIPPIPALLHGRRSGILYSNRRQKQMEEREAE